MNTPALEVSGLSKRFGTHQVTKQVDLCLMPGARTGLIGPNGSGKTTLINLLTGVLKPDAGAIRLGGRRIEHLGPGKRVRRGLVRTHQINSLLLESSVLENVALAVAERRRITWRVAFYRAQWRRCEEEAEQELARLGLGAIAHAKAGAIPYGAQRLLELAVALALQPSVLLLDEPAAGVATSEIRLLEEVLAALPQTMPILIIDHDINLVFRLSSEVIVLLDGSVIMRGTPEQVADDPTVRSAYLGRRAA